MFDDASGTGSRSATIPHRLGRTAACLRVALLLGAPSIATAALSAQQGGRVYRDPAGRFTVTVPTGWSAAPAGEGVVVTRGGAMAVFSPFAGAQSPQQVVATLGRQYSSQWRGLTPFNNGDFVIGGQPAAYAMYTGTNPKGREALLRIAGVVKGGDAYAIIVSVPREEFNDASPALQAIESSFALAGGGAAPRDWSGQPPVHGADGRQPSAPPASPPGAMPPGAEGRRRAVAGGAAPGRFYRMKWARIVDPYGFGQPVEVARLLIPADWQFQGEVRWGPSTGCAANLIHFSARATSPDGASGIEFFDSYAWQWHDDPMNRQTAQQAYQMYQMQPALRPCEMRAPTGAVDFIRQTIVPRARPGARVVGAEPLPQVAQARQAVLQGEYAAFLQAGVVRNLRVDAGKVVLAYQANGRPVEEWITGTIEMAAVPTPSASAAMSGGMAQVNMYGIKASNLIATRAPAGELERQSKLYATIVGSIRGNPQWTAAAQQVQTGIRNVAIEEAGKRNEIWRQTQQQIGSMITGQYRAQQAAQDRLAEQYSQSVRGTETFLDPSTRERVELTGGYQQAWSNGRGEYILSDDPNFNPAVALREQWVELQRPGAPR